MARFDRTSRPRGTSRRSLPSSTPPVTSSALDAWRPGKSNRRWLRPCSARSVQLADARALDKATQPLAAVRRAWWLVRVVLVHDRVSLAALDEPAIQWKRDDTRDH